MKIKKSRLGVVSHVGVVISFVIFITFLIFIYIIAKPAVDANNNQNLFDNLKNSIIEKTSAELTSVSLFIDKNVPQNCVILNNFFSEAGVESKILVRNKEGQALATKISGQNLFVEKKGGAEEVFFKIYESEGFDIIQTGEMQSCGNLNKGSGGYLFGLIKSEENLLEEEIIQLISEYNNDYEVLKEELNVAPGNEFKLSFVYSNETVISTVEQEILANVFINEVSIQYISKNVTREPGYLNIGIW